MKNIIIFEGIASSGKTTIEQRLLEQIPNSEIIEEIKTLMPLIDNRDEKVAKAYLSELLKEATNSRANNIIIDRFHFTHAFRTKTSIENFNEIESKLLEIANVTVILLTIESNSVRDRIEETLLYRKDGWTKGGQGTKTIDEKIKYYTDQQNDLIKMAKISTLRSINIDTTKKDWDWITSTILHKLDIK